VLVEKPANGGADRDEQDRRQRLRRPKLKVVVVQACRGMTGDDEVGIDQIIVEVRRV
jgi:hypothetical protein